MVRKITQSNPHELEAKASEIKTKIFNLVEEYCAIAHGPREFIAGISNVPVTGKVYGSNEISLLVESALDFWLTTGRFNTAFEKKLAQFLGTRFVLTCNSGSSANLLAVSALTSHLLKSKALKPGDEVITCATGFPTTVNPIIINQLIPVFVDVDIPTYNINVDAVESAISSRTKAIVVAHTLGNPFNLERIKQIAEKHDLFLIEDTCDALGALYQGKMVGTFGDIGTCSFYPAHHITMGEGGVVFTQNSVMKRILESMRDWGRDCWCEPGQDNTCGKRFEWTLGNLPCGYDHKYTYSHLGYNLKITDMQAAVGLGQLDRLDQFIATRRNNFAYLYEGFKALEEYFILPEATANSEPSWFGFPLTIRAGSSFTRNKLINYLTLKKIDTRLLFGGNLLAQPYMNSRLYRVAGSLNNSDIVMNNTLWIGLYPGLTHTHLSYTLQIFHDFIKTL